MGPNMPLMHVVQVLAWSFYVTITYELQCPSTCSWLLWATPSAIQIARRLIAQI